MSPMPSSCSAPCSPRMVRLSIFDVTWKEMRVGKFALIVPVMTSTDGRCVAMITWMPAARAGHRDLLVVASDVAHTELAHRAVAPFHLAHRPLQRADRLGRFGDDGR